MHVRNEHNTRIFYAARGAPRTNISTEYHKPSYASVVTSGSISNTPDLSSQDNNPSTSTIFSCQGPCSSVEKTFDHPDKLELHMKYYHGSQ